MVKQSFSAQSGNCLSLINFKQILTIQSADPFVPFIPSTSESFPNISSFRTICGPNSYSRQSSWAKSCEFSWAWIHLICVLRPNVWTSNSSNAFRLNTRKLQRYDYKQKDVFPCFAYGQVKLQFCLHKSLVFNGENDTISCLIEASADVNEQLRVPSSKRIWWLIFQKLQAMHHISPFALTYLAYHHYGAIPLIFSILTRKFETIPLLVGARNRDKSAFDVLPSAVRFLWKLRGNFDIWILMKFLSSYSMLFPEAVDLWQRSTYVLIRLQRRWFRCVDCLAVCFLSCEHSWQIKKEAPAVCYAEMVKRQEGISWYLKVERLDFFFYQPCQHVRWPSVITLLQSAAILSVTVPQLRFSFHFENLGERWWKAFRRWHRRVGFEFLEFLFVTLWSKASTWSPSKPVSQIWFRVGTWFQRSTASWSSGISCKTVHIFH